MAGFLTCFAWCAFPFFNSGGDAPSIRETYSSGYCAGLSPASLSGFENLKTFTINRCKDSIFFNIIVFTSFLMMICLFCIENIKMKAAKKILILKYRITYEKLYLCRLKILKMNAFKQNIKVIAFDADDTLWDNEPFFQAAEHVAASLLAEYGTPEEISKSLFDIEMKNMDDYGYGAVAFTMSLIENAVQMSRGKISGTDIGKIIEAGRPLVRLKATPLKGVRKTLETLKKSGKYTLVVFTKGELLTQENKLKRSGLLPFFDKIFIVTDKKEEDYIKLCSEMGIAPSELLMIGNSLRSDVLPALNVGAFAVHIPAEVMWQHEVIDDFENERMLRVGEFDKLLDIL